MAFRFLILTFLVDVTRGWYRNIEGHINGLIGQPINANNEKSTAGSRVGNDFLWLLAVDFIQVKINE